MPNNMSIFEILTLYVPLTKLCHWQFCTTDYVVPMKYKWTVSMKITVETVINICFLVLQK